MTYIFGYGSLMWNPRFPYIKAYKNTVLLGYHREYNKKSVREWGTEENPAPTLGLEEDGECVLIQPDDVPLGAKLY